MQFVRISRFRLLFLGLRIVSSQRSSDISEFSTFHFHPQASDLLTPSLDFGFSTIRMEFRLT